MRHLLATASILSLVTCCALGACGGGSNTDGADASSGDGAASDAAASDAAEAGSDDSATADAGGDAADSAVACTTALDPSFGTQGIAELASPPNPDPYWSAGFVLQGDGKILVAGYDPKSDVHALVARYNPDGTADTTFGTAGVATLTIETTAQLTFPTALAVQPDGKIVLAGVDVVAAQAHWFLTRLDTAGAVDTGFGTNGFAKSPMSGARPWWVGLRPGGSIVIVGDENPSPGTFDFLVAQFDSTGAIDTTFGTNGATTTPFAGGFGSAQTAVLQPDGKIVAGGTAYVPGDGGGDYPMALARYGTDGSLDSSFGSGGTTTTSLAAAGGYLAGMALQSTGAIVVAAGNSEGAIDDFYVLRYTPAGQLDAAFGTNGVTRTDFFGNDDTPSGVSVLAGDALVLGGTAIAPNDAGGVPHLALARYTPSGALDTAFGTGGKFVAPMPGDVQQALEDGQLLQSDGRLLLRARCTVSAADGGAAHDALCMARFACP